MKSILVTIAAILLSSAANAEDIPASHQGGGDSTWYEADGENGYCRPTPYELVESVEKYWAERGGFTQNYVTESDYPAITIFQGGDNMLLIYKSKNDCIAMLPVARKIALERTSR